MNKQTAIDDAQALIQMYKAGFLDGSGKKWEKIENKCKKAFDKRFKVMEKLKCPPKSMNKEKEKS